MLEHITHNLTEFIRLHQYWALPIIFILAFSESLALISLLVPATFILLGLSTLLGSLSLSFLPWFFAAALGAFFGDWISYWFGRHYQHAILDHRWLTKHHHLVKKGEQLFDRYGIYGVFIGRFFGPLRAIVPLVAGICQMNFWAFQLMNVLSALLWGFLILAPGAFGLSWLLHIL